jgi:hypothetical protein
LCPSRIGGKLSLDVVGNSGVNLHRGYILHPTSPNVNSFFQLFSTFFEGFRGSPTTLFINYYLHNLPLSTLSTYHHD